MKIDINTVITVDEYMTFFQERKCFAIPKEIVGLSDEDIFLLTKIGLPSQLVNDYIVVDNIEIINSKIVLARDRYLRDNCIYYDFNMDKNTLFFDNSNTIFSYSLKKGMLSTLIYCLFYKVYDIIYKERYSQKLNSQLIQVERIIEILINFNQFLPKIIW